MKESSSLNLSSALAEENRESDGSQKNWAGNLTYSTNQVQYPTTVSEVQDLVAQQAKLRVLGSRHSFNNIADSNHNLISLQAMNRIVSLDKEAHTLTIEAGVRYGDIAPFLHENGYALHNLASLPHITIAGACATATHGSGVNNGSLASAVKAIEVVRANGDIVTISRQSDPELFAASVVHLGALGVITRLTLDLLPAFDMEQTIYLDLPMQELKDHFANIQAEGYSISFFTDWKHKTINEVWIKRKVGSGAITLDSSKNFYGAKAATETVHPIAGQSAENVTEQMGIAGAWYERMPHFKMGFKPSAGEELQSEYFVPVEKAYEAIMAIETLSEKVGPHLLISEIRTIAADDFWMSPFYQRPSVAIHFTWKQHTAEVLSLLPMIEEKLAPFHPRPHWGKLFTMPAATLRKEYEKLPEFIALANELDPTGKFQNEYLQKHLFA